MNPRSTLFFTMASVVIPLLNFIAKHEHEWPSPVSIRHAGHARITWPSGNKTGNVLPAGRLLTGALVGS